MLRADIGSEKISENPYPLEDLSLKHKYKPSYFDSVINYLLRFLSENCDFVSA